MVSGKQAAAHTSNRAKVSSCANAGQHVLGGAAGSSPCDLSLATVVSIGLTMKASFRSQQSSTYVFAHDTVVTVHAARLEPAIADLQGQAAPSGSWPHAVPPHAKAANSMSPDVRDRPTAIAAA